MTTSIQIKLVIDASETPQLYARLLACDVPRRRAALMRHLAELGAQATLTAPGVQKIDQAEPVNTAHADPVPARVTARSSTQSTTAAPFDNVPYEDTVVDDDAAAQLAGFF